MKSASRSAPKLTGRRIGVTLVSLMFITALLPGLLALTTVPGLGDRCGEISGTVTVSAGEGEDPEAADGVIVTAYARGQASLIGSPVTSSETDGNGEYTLEVAEGRYTLAISDPSYTPEVYAIPDIINCGDVETVDFELEALGTPGLPDDIVPPVPGAGEGNLQVDVIETLSGSDWTRKPEGIAVDVYNGPCTIPASAGPAGVPTAASGETDADGRAVFDLAEGQYCVRTGESNMVNDEEQVSIGEDQLASVDFEIQKTNPRNFQGVIEDFDANPTHNIPGATITLFHPFYCPDGVAPEGVGYNCVFESDDRGGRVNYGSSGASERMPWAGSSDAYTIVVTHAFYNTKTKDVTISAANPDANPPSLTNTENVELSRAPASIEGVVQEEAGELTVTLEGHFTRLTYTTTTDSADGSFTLPVQSDAYRLTFSDGSGDVGFLCIAVGSEARDLGSFDLSDKNNVIEGTVFDSDRGSVGLGGATIRFAPSENIGSSSNDDRPDDECYVRNEADGGYKIGLPAGDYERNVTRPDWQTINGDVEIGGDETVDIDLLRQTGNIRGVVEELRLDSGHPVVGVQVPAVGVTVLCTNTHQLADSGPYEGISDEDGEYEVTVPFDQHPDSDIGAFTCETEHEHYHAGELADPVNVGPGQNNGGNDIQIERKLWFVTGVVYDAVSGETLEGASVCATNLASEDVAVPCSRSNETGVYSVGPFEISPVEDIGLNAVAAVATKPGYSAATQPVLIGTNSPSDFAQVDFELVPEDTADQQVSCVINNVLADPSTCAGDLPVPVPGGPMDVVPDELNCHGHDDIVNWLVDVILDTWCGNEPDLPSGGGAMDAVPEDLNCHGHDDVVDWGVDLILDPWCGGDPPL